MTPSTHISRKMIEDKALEIITKHILLPQLKDDSEFYDNLRYYHIVTPKLAEKLSDLFYAYGDDYTKDIGRYAYISHYGDPVTIDFLMNLDADDDTMPDALIFESIGNYEHLIPDHFSSLFSHHGGMRPNDISDMICYATLCLLEENR